ncbi:type II toxin-antitoxin system RelE/ParE family toxin [Dulcicalothrix desertica]|uniref:type II toxin-antitoxin system RelE/ParE family toxin n=1 Tax=Dulcicalothrix desertica TaxID=32056 RepID=UPI002D781282|nr:type II toxin-antitoxin system RelE/ParE family toxin [Dulcicalothrix desertica]
MSCTYIFACNINCRICNYAYTRYVLHAFQKKSTQGIKTPQPDIDLIKQHYKDAQEREKQA